MPLSISLYDPGMSFSADQAASWEDVPAVLEKHNRTYTDALISLNGKVIGVAKRELGERTWNVRKRSSV
jgi:hypothetical protein